MRSGSCPLWLQTQPPLLTPSRGLKSQWTTGRGLGRGLMAFGGGRCGLSLETRGLEIGQVWETALILALSPWCAPSSPVSSINYVLFFSFFQLPTFHQSIPGKRYRYFCLIPFLSPCFLRLHLHPHPCSDFISYLSAWSLQMCCVHFSSPVLVYLLTALFVCQRNER